MKHVVSDDYQQYLLNNEGSYVFPKTDYDAEYFLTPNTKKHQYEFRSAMTGQANLWVVNFGDILEKTLKSKDIQSAFKKLTKADSENDQGKMILKFNLIDYIYEGFEARVRLQISALKNGEVIFKDTYYEKGISQGGKMFWAGAFGMKNAIQQSTKSAIDKILEKLLNDMLSKNIR